MEAPVTPVSRRGWTEHEEACLVQLLALRAKLDDENEWPASKDPTFWCRVASELQEMADTPYCREGMSLRSKVGKLRSLHGTIDKAEVDLGLTANWYLEGKQPSPKQSEPSPKQLSLKSSKSPENALRRLLPKPSPEDALRPLLPLSCKGLELVCLHADSESLETGICLFFKKLSGAAHDKAVSLLDRLAGDLCRECGISNPDVVSSSLAAMTTLAKAGKNPLLVGKFARCIASKRPESSTSLMPLDRMPFALIEYQIEFFTARHVSRVKESPAFQLWRETMAAELTGSQNRLLRGPGWSGRKPTEFYNPLAARVNIACVSTKTTNMKLALTSEIGTEPVIQHASISALVKAGVKRVWLKADACDLKVCLQHSVREIWNGDEDLGDGKLQNIRSQYDARLATCKEFLQAVGAAQEPLRSKIIASLEDDLVFLSNGLQISLKEYQKKQAKTTSRTETVTQAMWQVADFNILLQQAHVFLQLLQNRRKVSCFSKGKDQYYKYVADLYKKHRIAATHVLVFLASDEKRNKKPYSVPLQYVPIRSIRDQYVRDLTKPLKAALKEAGILVVGTTTDGEFCSLRSLGDTRPIHLWQIIRDSRLAVSRMKRDHLENILFPVAVNADGNLVMVTTHPAVPVQVIIDMHTQQQTAGWSREQCVHQKRTSLVPEGLQPYPFRRNTEESYLDKLRSLVGTYIYRKAIQDLYQQGVDFKTHLYVPEIDVTTLEIHHERADHCHLLKRIAGHTRELRYPPLTQEPFVEAMQNPDTGLTHAAMAGERKQSVADAERLLSHRVAAFMQRQGYEVAAEYMQTIADWHEASDGRGLAEELRSQKNKAMWNYLVKDFMPWFHTCQDFSLQDINRPMDNIRGFSRESFVEVTTNIESQELRRTLSAPLGPEHPRAGTTDDCEAFFAICHRYLGNVFTLQDFKYRWAKIVHEFSKKTDPSLPFYYWTPSSRYQEEEESFNDPVEVPDDVNPKKDPRRLHRLTVNKREDASVFASGRAYLPPRHAQSIRRKFHAVATAADLPPVPQHLLPQNMEVE